MELIYITSAKYVSGYILNLLSILVRSNCLTSPDSMTKAFAQNFRT